jgi:uncharacterized protein
MEGSVKPKWLFGRIFEPTTDFYEMLNVQARKTLEGVEALADWMSKEDCSGRCETVRERETEADALKFELSRRLVESFITPFDREDIFELSQRLDEVINGAKAIAREIEAFETRPSDYPEMAEMTAFLVEGTSNLVFSFSHLRKNHSEAQSNAILACKSENKLTKTYRRAMQDLFHSDDMKAILRVREVYKAHLTCAEKIGVVGERLLYAIVKMI